MVAWSRLSALVVTCLALTSACGDDAVDDVRWACAEDRACGAGARCRLGVCVREDAEPSSGLACEVAADQSGLAPRFRVEGAADGTRALVFAVGAREARYVLPSEVATLESGPLETCCANPCCALVAP